MTDSIAAFIFDMDGTLIDNMHMHSVVWEKFLAQRGHPIEAQIIEKRFAGMKNPDILRSLLGEGISDAQAAELSAQKEDLYRQMYRPVMKPVAGLIPFLESAWEMGIPMAVASSAPPENVRFHLEGIGAARFFSLLVDADQVSRGKPDPQMYLLTAQRLNQPPEACLVFEDSLIGLTAAYRAGMHSVAITTTVPASKLREQLGVVRVIDDFTELDPAELIHDLHKNKPKG